MVKVSVFVEESSLSLLKIMKQLRNGGAPGEAPGGFKGQNDKAIHHFIYSLVCLCR
jgi:hypothetical protein